MRPLYVNGNVRAACPDCDGAVTTFEMKLADREFGSVLRPGLFELEGRSYQRAMYVLLRCASCGRGGLATVYDTGPDSGGLVDFYPLSRDVAPLPTEVPLTVAADYRS